MCTWLFRTVALLVLILVAWGCPLLARIGIDGQLGGFALFALLWLLPVWLNDTGKAMPR